MKKRSPDSSAFSIGKIVAAARSDRLPATTWRSLALTFAAHPSGRSRAGGPARRGPGSSRRGSFASALRRLCWPSRRLPARHRRAISEVGRRDGRRPPRGPIRASRPNGGGQPLFAGASLAGERLSGAVRSHRQEKRSGPRPPSQEALDPPSIVIFANRLCEIAVTQVFRGDSEQESRDAEASPARRTAFETCLAGFSARRTPKTFGCRPSPRGERPSASASRLSPCGEGPVPTASPRSPSGEVQLATLRGLLRAEKALRQMLQGFLPAEKGR